MMFLGHFAVAFGAKKFYPRLSLGTLFIASQFLDLLWPVLLILGVERVRVDPGNTVVTPLAFEYYPISHSLLMVLGWAVLFAVGYRLIRQRKQGTVLIGIVVVSHWILDLITHRPDLPLVPGGTMMAGLGLWNSQVGTLLFEGALFILGVRLYLFTTYTKDRIGRYGFWALVIFLVLVYLANIFGPPPPDDTLAIASMGLAMWILVLWAYWVDRHRR